MAQGYHAIQAAVIAAGARTGYDAPGAAVPVLDKSELKAAALVYQAHSPDV